MIEDRTGARRTERRSPQALLGWATRKRDEVLQRYRQCQEVPYRGNRQWRSKNQIVMPYLSRELAKWDRLVNRYRQMVEAEGVSA